MIMMITKVNTREKMPLLTFILEDWQGSLIKDNGSEDMQH